MKRVGHKGAALIAPGNTLASFDAALQAGIDMVEFDVLPARPLAPGEALADVPLVLAHDFTDAASREPLTLERALEHLSQAAWHGIELDVDLKLPGYERRVVEALRAFDLVGRSLVSTMEVESLPRLRAEEPELRLGWSVPKVRRNYLAHRLTRPAALAAARCARAVLPERAARAIRAGRVDALMAHWSVVTPRLVSAIDEAGGELYVWTVDDATRIAEFERLGVTAVISNDPRLFATG